MQPPYYKFSQYLKSHYGEKVYKVCVDAGFSCPNRRNKNGYNGCIFCRVDSFSKLQSLEKIDIDDQIEQGIFLARERLHIDKYIVYFQASTNTYAPVDVLETMFRKAITHKGVVGLSIATRPDCLSAGVIELLKTIAGETDLWIELGLQSTHNSTLERIQRGHSYEDYLSAVERLTPLPVRICTHMMLGLPGEGKKEIISSAKKIAASVIHEVKIHPLLILEETPLAELYRGSKIKALSLADYTKQVCDFLEELPSRMVIQRLSAEAPDKILIAPRWALNKHNVFQSVENEFRKRGSRQGIKFEG
jgi:hypothetical protein